MQLTDKPENIEGWLEQLGQPSADRDYKPGHQRMHELLAATKLRRPKLRIRIAGTNGKGSTAFMLANALQACGLTVGLYTSPHIHHFHERIRINGEPVADATLLALLEATMPTALAIGASYFEVATALALQHFSRATVDVEILEAGVGARLDATTAVPADMALLTPIGLDHQAWLGETLAKIAQEKAHIADGCRFAISAPQQREVAAVLGRHTPSLITVAADAADIAFPAAVAGEAVLAAVGKHQRENATLAWSAVQMLAKHGIIHPQSVPKAKAAIQATAVPGRLQKITFGEATLWLDAAHNSHAIEALLPTLPALANPFDAILLFTREDRDLTASIGTLKQLGRRVVGRGEPFETSDSETSDPETNYPDVTAALAAELKRQPQGRYLILGSFLTVAAALAWLDSHSR